MESLEKIIPLIFIILWSLMAAAGKKKKKQARQPLTTQTEKPREKRPLVNRLYQTLEQVISELEQPVFVNTSETGPKEAPRKRSLIPDEDTKETGNSERNEIADKQPVPPRPQYTLHPEKRPENYAVTQLRKAVVWSEILAKPVALRNDNHVG